MRKALGLAISTLAIAAVIVISLGALHVQLFVAEPKYLMDIFGFLSAYPTELLVTVAIISILTLYYRAHRLIHLIVTMAIGMNFKRESRGETVTENTAEERMAT